ncbi:hypothetical protein N5D61_10350 [Pseudomonas sp. GD03842]|nr:hypothetical protein [Pseudomonas sp. GD03842]MDH0746746.1 hypothetical protein [Pseudomonas sp. GD03842]
MDRHPKPLVERWRALLIELHAARGHDCAMHALANPEWVDLAMSGQTVVV